MNIPTYVQDIIIEEHIPTIYLDSALGKMSSPWNSNQSPEPSTPLQPKLYQLTSKLTQSMKQNEGYVKLIWDLWEDNKELWLHIKNMEDLHKTVSLSQRDWQERRGLLKV